MRAYFYTFSSGSSFIIHKNSNTIILFPLIHIQKIHKKYSNNERIGEFTKQMSNESNLPKLCLNMIVKNESLVIERLLQSVVNIIDTYCIEDTGSTDDTPSIIQNFFEKHGIPGKIVHEKFINFAYNRTHAYNQCNGMSEYVLFLDADMIFVSQISKEELLEQISHYTVHHIFQGVKSSTFYKNVRIVKNNLNAKYVTPTHEYFVPPPDATYNTFDSEKVFIDDRGDGGCKSNKFQRDVELLSKELETNPDDVRCMFYLANSYRYLGNIEKAMECYQNRINMGGWIEEKWQSAYAIGEMYYEQNEVEKAIYYWIYAYNIFPNRIENLYRIIKHYREKGQYTSAYSFYQIAKYSQEKYRPWDYLFTQMDVYEYWLDYEFSIIGYYCNTHNYNVLNSCMKVFACPYTNNTILQNTISNYKFYAESISKYAITLPVENELALLVNVEFPGFVSSTPSFAYDDGNKILYVCTRFVNYHINEKGEYINQERIETKNVMRMIDVRHSRWKLINTTIKTKTVPNPSSIETKTNSDVSILLYDESWDERYVGIEDVRLFFSNNKLFYNGNRGLPGYRMAVEHGEIDTSFMQTVQSRILSLEDVASPADCEKNWVLFRDSLQNTKCVYSWSPIRIGDIAGDKFVTTHYQTELPSFFKHIRGSANGVWIEGGEVWFLCHLVSYEDRRYYYHIIIVLDDKTFRLKKYTTLFTFEKEKVEYSLGFVYFQEQKSFLIGYSLLDKCTKFMNIRRHIFDKMMICV